MSTLSLSHARLQESAQCPETGLSPPTSPPRSPGMWVRVLAPVWMEALGRQPARLSLRYHNSLTLFLPLKFLQTQSSKACSSFPSPARNFPNSPGFWKNSCPAPSAPPSQARGRCALTVPPPAPGCAPPLHSVLLKPRLRPPCLLLSRNHAGLFKASFVPLKASRPAATPFPALCALMRGYALCPGTALHGLTAPRTQVLTNIFFQNKLVNKDPGAFSSKTSWDFVWRLFFCLKYTGMLALGFLLKARKIQISS